MEMTLASELRDLMPSNKAEALRKVIIEKMKEIAKKDHKQCRLSSVFNASEPEWTESVYFVYSNGMDKWKKEIVLGKIFAELEKEGITTKFLYEERQFVDMDILISWA
jgi:hypothetical protein